jgi:hypothetical protein
MIRPILIAALLAMAGATNSQNLELETHTRKLADFIRIEQSIGSERLENTETIFLPDGTIPAVRFKRKEKAVPDMVAYYYFRKDSSIYNVLYEWDDENFIGHDKVVVKTQGEIRAFVEKYKEIISQVSRVFGQSKVEGGVKDLSKVSKGEFQEIDTWNPNDSTSVESYVVLSSLSETHGMVSTRPTYRIRLYITNTVTPIKAAETGKPGEDRVNAANLVVREFLKSLRVDSLAKSRLELADRILPGVTDEQLEGLAKSIRFDDTLVIYMNGYQMDLQGTSYLMIQYKYASDTDNPPKEMLGVIFDDKNKILGIQPKKQISGIKLN